MPRPQTVLLIGPMGVGKTTVARALASRLDLPYIDVDELRWAYFDRMPDYDGAAVEAMFENGEEAAAFAYFKPFEARLVAMLLSEYKTGVYDFGAGYSVYDDPGLFESVRAAFDPHENVIFLRYCQDPEESLAALAERHEDVPEPLYEALNRPFIQSPCNSLLATHTVDTKGLSPEAVTEAVLSCLC